ncbi:MAG: DUF3761 domain-containing protein [Candidatus Spechtbacterales bacterium]|nr:DUF3761 domain-containing protein [Candidatus Spechtbacterales bacterium]
MENKDTREWYQKKRFIIPALLIGATMFAGGMDDGGSTATTPNSVAPYQESVQQKAPATTSNQLFKDAVEKREPTTSNTRVKDVPLSNDNYYINTDGESVHSPAYAPAVPAGASAKCRDGTYSFSRNRRGTCSRHGGVAYWL